MTSSTPTTPAQRVQSDGSTVPTGTLREHLFHLTGLLPSYFNLYQAIQFRMVNSAARVTELAEDSELSRCVLRLRKQKPELWTIGEIQQMAWAMNLSAGICDQLIPALDQLGDMLLAEPPRTNAALLQACDIHRLRFRRRNGDKWTFQALHKLYRGAERR